MDRREFLAAAGAAGLCVTAGCTGSGTGDGNGGDGTEAATASPTATESATPTDTATATATSTATDTPTATPTPTPSGATTVALYNNYFQPVRASVPVGGTVTWENRASGTYSSHTVTSRRFHDAAAEWSFDARLNAGETATYTFERAGVYEYVCTIHGKTSMCGAVLVGDVTLDASLPCE